jgi:hypothetical protein
MSSTETLVCAIPFISPHGNFSKGEVVAVDHPAVTLMPHAFVKPGTPTAEWPSPLDAHISRMADREAQRRAEEEAAFLAEARANPLKLAGPELVKLKKDLPARWAGRVVTLKKGSVAEATEMVVQESPNHWEPL